MNSSAAIMGFVLGSAAGLALGMFFAPKSGKENREELRQQAISNFNRVQQKMKQRQHEATDKIDEINNTAKDTIETLENAVQDEGLPTKATRLQK